MMQNEGQSGFVLPYVLVVIAVLSIATTIAAQRLQNITSTLGAVNQQANADLAFATAEAEAIFTILTSVDVSDGLDVNPDNSANTNVDNIIRDIFASPADGAQDKNIDLWSIGEGQRKSTTPFGDVLITMQDAQGLLSLNKTQREPLAKVLRASGLEANASRTMAARILDYIDEDNSRQFLGGERADYRLRGKEPPTNEPLRNFEELARVLGWTSESKSLDMDTFMSLTTIQLTDGLKQKFVPPKLAAILGIEPLEDGISFEASLDNLGGISSTPSGSFRLCFTLYNRFDKEEHRCIEVNRKSQHVDKPFQRHWVYQRRAVTNDMTVKLSNLDKVKNVISTPAVQTK